jgi:hypothetical protein
MILDTNRVMRDTLSSMHSVLAIGVLLLQGQFSPKGLEHGEGWSPPRVVDIPDTIVIVHEEDIVIDDGPDPATRPSPLTDQRTVLHRSNARVVRASFWQRVLNASESL